MSSTRGELPLSSLGFGTEEPSTSVIFAPVRAPLVNSHLLFLAAAVVLVDMTAESFHVLIALLMMTKAGMANQIAYAYFVLAHL
jgi:hypothetical protein